MGGIRTNNHHCYHYQSSYYGYPLWFLLLPRAVLPQLLSPQLPASPAPVPLSRLSANRFRRRRVLARYEAFEDSPTGGLSAFWSEIDRQSKTASRISMQAGVSRCDMAR